MLIKIWYSKPEFFRAAICKEHPSWPDSYDMIAEEWINDPPKDLSYEDFLANLKKICEFMFERYNIGHPVGWNNRSMSVGDVIQVGEVCLHCDSMGWSILEPADW